MDDVDRLPVICPSSCSPNSNWILKRRIRPTFFVELAGSKSDTGRGEKFKKEPLFRFRVAVPRLLGVISKTVFSRWIHGGSRVGVAG